MDPLTSVGIGHLIDSMNEGVYVCDLDRRIRYWSRSAERITGWRAEDVVGRCCYDNVLCHVDKDGHRLCGEEYCPLHRSMVTGAPSGESLLVYAQSKQGGRVPMHVSVAPLRDAAGHVIGGVETFRDASATARDLERARSIQRRALRQELPVDGRVTFTTHYIPHGIVGGDYFAVEPLDANRYGILLADVMGHGIAAALYTMHLSQLWGRHRAAAAHPADLARMLNRELAGVLRGDRSFATIMCGLLDLDRRAFRFTGAGWPPILLVHPDGTFEARKSRGLPLGMFPEAEYDALEAELGPGDRLLLFSDGAVEVIGDDDEFIDVAGLIAILRSLEYPARDLRMDELEEALLRASHEIRLPDDLTLIEVHVTGQ